MSVPTWREASRRLHASGDDEPYATDVPSDEAWRRAAWNGCPHDGKYGDDGEMQCRGTDFRRQPIADLIAHLTRATDVPSERVDRFGRPRIGPRRPLRAATPDDQSRVDAIAALREQHRLVEVVDSDGDDWLGCICGERNEECAVLRFLATLDALIEPESK